MNRALLLITLLAVATPPGLAHARGRASASATLAISGGQAPLTRVSTPQVKAIELEDPSGVALDRFFGKLLQLERSGAGRVRVMHWGDSHVAPDALTARLRNLLQQRFGDAGPGLVLAGRPWRSYRHSGAKLGVRGRWRAERIWSRYNRKRRQPRDDLFGVAGISVHTRWRAAATIEPKGAPLRALDVYYLRQPRGGRIDVRVGGRVIRRVFTVGSRKQPGYAMVRLPRNARRVELRTSGGEVRLFAVDLIRSDVGVICDTLGINGARADTSLQWNEALIADQLQRAAPDLVVLAYGSNEVDSRGMTRDSFAHGFSEVLRRMRRVSPEADCLVVGPPSQARYSKETGWTLPGKLDYVVAEQRRLAAQHRCAFWDQRAAMGGRRAIFHWVVADPPLARSDHLHLRWDGYVAVGEALHDALISGYRAFRVRLAAQPDAADATP